MAEKDKEKKTTTKKSSSTAKKSTAAKKTTTKKTSTAKKSTTTTKTTATKKTTTKRKEPTKAELRAQEAKKKRTVKKTAAELAAEKEKAEKAKAAKKAKEELAAQEALRKIQEEAEKAKRKLSKIKTTDKDVKISTSKSRGIIEDENFSKVIVLDFDNKKLNKDLFASEKIYEQAIFDVIMAERASRRQGTHAVKNRSAVSGGGKKPWRQKGTGRARAGSIRSPLWVGGGVTFGPQPDQNYKRKVNKKVRLNAFISALTLLANNKAVIIDDFKLKKISTKEAVEKLSKLKLQDIQHILIVTNDEVVYKSVANLPNVICVRPNSVSIENLVWADALVLSNEGLKNFEVRIK